MKKEGLRKWFGRNNGKGWIDCKTGKPCGRKSAKGGSKDYIQPVGLLGLNATQQRIKRKVLRISWKKGAKR